MPKLVKFEMEKSGAVERVSVMVVLAVYVPLVTVTVTGNVPDAAVVELTTKSRYWTEFTAVVKVCCGTVTPVGSPVTDPFAFPVNPPTPKTLSSAKPVWPRVSERLEGEAVTTNPGATCTTSENCACAERVELEHEIVSADVPETAASFSLN